MESDDLPMVQSASAVDLHSFAQHAPIPLAPTDNLQEHARRRYAYARAMLTEAERQDDIDRRTSPLAVLTQAFGHSYMMCKRERAIRMFEEVLEYCLSLDIAVYELLEQLKYTAARHKEQATHSSFDELADVWLTLQAAMQAEGTEQFCLSDHIKEKLSEITVKGLQERIRRKWNEGAVMFNPPFSDSENEEQEQ